MKILMIQWIEQWGYAGIFLLILIENVFPPIPSEVILTFSGYLCRVTDLGKWGVILAATAGSVIGAILLYYLGYLLDDDRLQRFCSSRLGRLLHFSYGDIHRSRDWFLEKGTATVLVCRCIPILRSVISIPAGMARMRMLVFLPLTIAGSFLWNVILVNLGILAGEAWETVSERIGACSDWVLRGLCATAILFLLLRKIQKNRRHTESVSETR